MTIEERARTLAITHGVDHGGQRILDPEVVGYLSNINEEGDDLLIELIDLFEGDASVRVHRLLAAADAGDFTEVARIAHALKNASATMGALAFAAVCKELESGASDQRDVTRLLTGIEGMFEEVVSVLSELRSVSGQVPPSDRTTKR